MNPEPLKKKIGEIDIGEGIDKGILDLRKGTLKIPKEIQLKRQYSIQKTLNQQ